MFIDTNRLEQIFISMHLKNKSMIPKLLCPATI